MIGIPEKNEFKVNETGIINFGFWKYGEIREFKIYRRYAHDEIPELIYDGLKNAQFKFEFTPNSIDDNVLDLYAEFEFKGKDTKTIEIPAKMVLNVVE